eukprot:m.12627 g.12627  ORF g.12627 m.12627 type:complete len:347 (+) comp8144_c0_seq1:485-1525(+)
MGGPPTLLFLGQVLVMLAQNLPARWAHEAIWGLLTRSSKSAHLGSRNELIIFLLLRVEEVHVTFLGVVGSHTERNDFKALEAGRHLQDFTSVMRAVKIFLSGRMAHTSRVTANNVEACASILTSLCVPLDLSGTSVHHGRGEDGQHSMCWGQHTFSQDSVVLAHAHSKWDIIGLSPATQRMEQQSGIFKSTLLELSACVLHEQSVAVMDGVTQLEGVHGISASFFEFGAKLKGGESVFVKSIVPFDLVKDFQLSANKPFTIRKHLLDVRVSSVGNTPLTRASFLLAGLVDLGFLQDGNIFALIHQSNGVLAFNSGLFFIVAGKNNWDGHVGVFSAGDLEAVEMEGL